MPNIIDYKINAYIALAESSGNMVLGVRRK
jgi:hypothetical protein